jgi:O-antigen ligase
MCLLAFCLSLVPTALPVILVFVLATHLLDRSVWRDRPVLKLDPGSPILWSILLFLLHVIGMTWTSNMDFGWFDISIKLPLLLLPLLSFLMRKSREERDVVLLAFVAGVGVAVVVCSLLALLRCFSIEGLGVEEFLSSRFSAVLHPSYFALYLVIATACYFLGGLKDHIPEPWGKVLLFLLCAGVVLSQSRMGWITLPIVLGWSLIHCWQDRGTRVMLLGVLVSSLLGGTVLTIVSEGVRYRVMELFQPTDPATADAGASAAVRTVVWRAARDVGARNMPLGTGTGDVKDELLLEYKAIGAVHALERKLNAHNQFLQTFAALGIPGLLVLALLFVVPLRALLLRKGEDRALKALFLVVVTLNFSVESMLEVQAGALFTGFMLWVLWRHPVVTPSSPQ